MCGFWAYCVPRNALGLCPSTYPPCTRSLTSRTSRTGLGPESIRRQSPQETRWSLLPATPGGWDDLVARGMVAISEVSHTRDGDGRVRLEGRFRLRNAAGPAMDAMSAFPDEERTQAFLSEVALGLSGVAPGHAGTASLQDAAYGDPTVVPGNVLDFGEWQQRNAATNAARILGAGASRDHHASRTTAPLP